MLGEAPLALLLRLRLRCCCCDCCHAYPQAPHVGGKGTTQGLAPGHGGGHVAGLATELVGLELQKVGVTVREE